MGTRAESTPSFELPAPTESHAGRAMRSRIAGRLFDEPGPSQRVAHYEILRRVGAGGMGVVYAARDTKLDRVVALKLVRQRAMSVRARERLVQEAQTLAKLSHPNVVQVYEVGEYEAAVYIAMEFVEGQTLGKWLAANKPSLSVTLEVFRAAGEGLTAAHTAGVIHRDLKPTNLLVSTDGRLRVADFGLAWSGAAKARANPPSPSLRRVAGTPGYIAPELLEGASANELSDQFALCVSLSEVLTGVRPAPGAVLDIRPYWLRRVLERGIAEHPDQRWVSVAEFVRALDRRPRILRRGIAGLLGVGLAAGLAVSPLIQNEDERCGQMTAELEEELWPDERRDAVLRKLRAHPEAWTDQLAARVDDELRDQLRVVAMVRSKLCRAGLVEGDEPSRDLDLAARCLDRHEQRLATFIDLLETSQPEYLENYDRLLDELGDPRDCTEGARLLEIAPPPTIAPEVQFLEAQLDELRLTIAGGDFRTAADTSQRLLERAIELDYPPLVAEAHLVSGRIQAADGRHRQALESNYNAALAAEAAGNDELVFQARRQLTSISAEDLDDLDAARRWHEHSEASFRRLHRPKQLEAALLDAGSELALASGDLNEAEDKLHQAVEIAKQHNNPRLVSALRLSLANVLADQGQTHRVIALYDELLRDRTARLGPDHPDVARVEFDLGLCRYELGELDPARAHFERALAIQSRSYDDEAPELLPSLTMLAQIALDRGDTVAVVAYARQLIPGEQRAYSVDDPRKINGWRLLAHAYMSEHDYTHAREVEELLALSGRELDAETQAALAVELAWVLCRSQRCSEARPVIEFVLGRGDHLLQTYARAYLAEIELSEGHPLTTLTLLETNRADAHDIEDPELDAYGAAIEALALAQTPGIDASTVESARARSHRNLESLPPDLEHRVESEE